MATYVYQRGFVADCGSDPISQGFVLNAKMIFAN